MYVGASYDVAELGGQALTNYGTSNVKNHRIMRVADVKLMLAEIAIREGDLGTANSLINEVRKRAANSYVKAEAGITVGTYTFEDKVNGKTVTDAAANYALGLYPAFGSEAEAWTALKRERRAELAFEGHRFFDLARWGDVGETLGKYVAFERQYLANILITLVTSLACQFQSMKSEPQKVVSFRIKTGSKFMLRFK